MQFLSLCKNPCYVTHIFVYDILEAWTLRAGCGEFYLPWDHVNSQKYPTLCLQDCFCSAKIPPLENSGVHCHWSHSGARVGGPRGYPGATWQHWQHPYEPGLHRGSCRTTCTSLPPDAHLNLHLTPCLCYEKRKTEISWLTPIKQTRKRTLAYPKAAFITSPCCALCPPHQHKPLSQEDHIPLLWEQLGARAQENRAGFGLKPS